MRPSPIPARASRRVRGPVAYLHVPKTAGTSVACMLRGMRPWRHVLTARGNITLELVAQCAALPAGERRDTLIHGHPFHGTLAGLTDTVLLTVLRDPEEHAVSNYLHVLRDADTPLHHEARALPFDAFVRRHWQWLVFQAISLNVAASAHSIDTPEEFFSRLPAIRDVLRRIDVVGTTDDLAGFAACLARRLGGAVPRVEHLHRSVDLGATPDRVREMRAAYRALAGEPTLARLMREERALYEAARNRARRQRRAARIASAVSRAWRADPGSARPG